MRISFLALGASALVLAFAAAGCGGGSSNDTLSYSDFGTQADQLCSQGEAAVKAANLGPSDLAKFGQIIQPYVDRLKALKAPDELKSAQSDFVSISEQQIDAANKGDDKTVESLSAQSDAAGSKMGAPACAKS